jgi:protein-S-isoprenylcysteine O-methyltransferase Ste14
METVKQRFALLMGSRYRYYRLLYSIFAFIHLGIVLWYQFSEKSTRLWPYADWIWYPTIAFGVAGLTVMLICIRKYFFYLSGVDVLSKKKITSTLQVGGLHRYVRHPLYAGTLLFAGGIFFLLPTIANAIALTFITVYTLIGIRIEEKKLIAEFGEQYIRYASSVPKLLPRIRIFREP